jgi:hypothetical protein
MTDCELMVIERRDFIAYLRSQHDLTMQIIEILCSRLRQTSEQVQDVTFLDLPKRLAKALLRLIADTEGQASIRKATITQREISQIIGRSRESTNRQLRIWAAHGWIRLERGAITVLRREKIAEAAAEGPSSIRREPVIPPRSSDAARRGTRAPWAQRTVSMVCVARKSISGPPRAISMERT